MLFKGLDHITITASDPRKSIEFYRDVLGLELAYEWPGDVTMLRCGDQFLAIAWWAKGTKNEGPRPSIAVHHYAFKVDAATFENAKTELPERGVKVDSIEDHGIHQSLYFQDPDGHILELACYEFSGSAAQMPIKLRKP